MEINVKYNVGEKIKRSRNCFATTSHSGSSMRTNSQGRKNNYRKRKFFQRLENKIPL